MNRKSEFASVIVAGVVLAHSFAAGADWPQFREQLMWNR